MQMRVIIWHTLLHFRNNGRVPKGHAALIVVWLTVLCDAVNVSLIQHRCYFTKIPQVYLMFQYGELFWAHWYGAKLVLAKT